MPVWRARLGDLGFLPIFSRSEHGQDVGTPGGRHCGLRMPSGDSWSERSHTLRDSEHQSWSWGILRPCTRSPNAQLVVGSERELANVWPILSFGDEFKSQFPSPNWSPRGVPALETHRERALESGEESSFLLYSAHGSCEMEPFTTKGRREKS